MWIIGYLLRGILALIVSVVCLAVWAVVGLFYWIPILARASAWFSAALLIAAVTDKPATQAARALDRAAVFYVNGFKRIIQTLFELFRTKGSSGEPQATGEQESFKFSLNNFGLFLAETAFATTSWILALAFMYYWFGSLDFLYRLYDFIHAQWVSIMGSFTLSTS